MNNSPEETLSAQSASEAEDHHRDAAKFFLAAIVESSRDSIVTVDFDGVITTWNKAAEQLYGYRAGEAIGQQLVQLTFPRNLSEVLRNIENVKQSQKVEVFDSVRINKGGHEMHLEVSMSPVKDEHGRVVGVSTIARDHTAAKLLQQERDRLLQEHQQARQQAEEAQSRAEEAQSRAEEAQRAAEQNNLFKDRFIAVVSHEMRTPLTSIHGWLSVLRSGKLQEPDISNGLDVVQRGADTLVRLVNDLLDVERMRTDKLQLEKEPVNLLPVLFNAIEGVRYRAEEKSISIHTKPLCADHMVVGDAGRLEQILLNLLSNAVKFTPKGGSVEVCMNCHDKEHGKEVEFTVSDTGKGISPEFLPYVFEQFRQEEESHSRSYGGLGLGLYIVRELVELHGGTIQAESDGEGKGATFRVRFPAEPAR
jgi:PAS domain S-box-containing protein